MTKIKLTRKQVHGERVYAVPFCEAQYLLAYEEPWGYNAGVYGWNWDLYQPRLGVQVCTGYRNIVGEYIDREILKKYNTMAEKIVHSEKYIPYDETRKMLWDLWDQMLGEIKVEG